MNGTMEMLDFMSVAVALRDLGRTERVLIDGGHLEELVPLAAQRADLVAQLDVQFAAHPKPPADVAAVLRVVRDEGQENLTRLRLAQAEIADQLALNDTAGRAVNGYGKTSRY